MSEPAEAVRRRAGNRYEYCRLPQAAFRRGFHTEHIVARQHGGSTSLDNLAFATGECKVVKARRSAVLPGDNVFSVESAAERRLRQAAVLVAIAGAPRNRLSRLTHAGCCKIWRSFDCQYTRRSLTLMYASSSASSSSVSSPSLARTFSSSIRAASPSGKSKAKMLSASARVIPRLGKSNTLSNTSACGLELNLNVAILSLFYACGEKPGAICRKQARRIAEGTREKVLVTPVVVEKDRGAPRYRIDTEVADRCRRPGVAVGLAWTPVGGDVLFIEAGRMPGGNKGLIMTGQLGPVMQESVQAALTWVRGNATKY